MHRRHFDGWKADVARASVISILYVAGMALGLSKSFLYGGGIVGVFPFLLALFLGPWAAAWITCILLPTSRRRLVLRLAAGTFAGIISCWVALGLGSALTPEWPTGDPRTRFIARHDASLVLIPLFVFLFAGALLFSRWKSRLSL